MVDVRKFGAQGLSTNRKDSLRGPMQLVAEQCDTLEEALRTLVLPFFERPNAPWIHTMLTKVSRRSVRGCVCWLGASPATLKANAYWPEEGGVPCVEVWRWNGDALTAAYGCRELRAQATGVPCSPSPPEELSPFLSSFPSDRGTLGPLLQMLMCGTTDEVVGATVCLGSSQLPLPREAMRRLAELASAEPRDPMISMPASIALSHLENRSLSHKQQGGRSH
jgi:hypothetical protein